MEAATAANGWVNTIDGNNPEVLETARNIIKNNCYCTLSTCSPDGYPWVSPVFFACDDRWNLYWSSAIVARHSQNIYGNHGRMAVTIFDSRVSEGPAKGVYFYGVASELEPERLEEIFQLMARRSKVQIQRKAVDYLDDSPRRMYQFKPTQVWTTGTRLPVGNQLVDTKIEIRLLDL